MKVDLENDVYLFDQRLGEERKHVGQDQNNARDQKEDRKNSDAVNAT